MKKRKRKTKKKIREKSVWTGTEYFVRYGELKTGPGRPGVQSLFAAVGEKLPFDSLPDVRKHFKHVLPKPIGVYVAHDSMGWARYVGQGRIFSRLDSHQKSHPGELKYFSFYVLREKTNIDDIETLLIRTASPLLAFNIQKKRATVKAGGVKHYQHGTHFYERRDKVKRRRSRRSA